MRKKMKKMRTLVRNNAEKNKAMFNQEVALLRKEMDLKNKARKDPKYKKKLEKFRKKKDELIAEVYRDHSKAARKQREAELVLKDMSKQEIDEAIEHEGALIDENRLKSYNL